MGVAVARKPPTAKPRFGAAKKPAAKSGGLGVKKMTSKVDDSLFEQAPAEEPVPAATLSALAPTLSVRIPLPMHNALDIGCSKQQQAAKADLVPVATK